MNDNRRKMPLRGLVVVGSGISGIGCAVPILVILAIFVGRQLDSWLGTTPWILLGLILGSMVMGIGLMLWLAYSAAQSVQHQYDADGKPTQEISHNPYDLYGEE